MPTIYDRIKQDHDEARALIRQIEDTTDRAAKTRQDLFDRFKLDLWSHNKIEEATFYSKLEQKGDKKESLEAKNEHHMVNSMLEELDTMPKDNVEWGQKFHALAELLEHHMDEEEDEFFELARKDLTEEEAEDLGERFDSPQESRDAGPQTGRLTHPSTPLPAHGLPCQRMGGPCRPTEQNRKLFLFRIVSVQGMWKLCPETCGRIPAMERESSMKTMRFLIAGAAALALAACGKGGEAGRDLSEADSDYQSVLLEQLIDAQPGDVIEIPAGVYRFDRSLSLNVDGVTIRGAGMDETILNFQDQVAGAEGLIVTANDFTLENLAIEDTIGDGLKVNGGENIIIRGVRVEWTNGYSTDNGAYGIYPVQTTNVLVENAVAIGASDAGIYVGQSRNVVVRDSRAEYNVAGIEIENCIGADVYRNVATNNTGGILVFNMPNLPQPGYHTRVYDNDVFSNNTENFGHAGTPVASVPAGRASSSIPTTRSRSSTTGFPTTRRPTSSSPASTRPVIPNPPPRPISTPIRRRSGSTTTPMRAAATHPTGWT